MPHPLDCKPGPAAGRRWAAAPKPANPVPPSRIDRLHGPVLRDPTPAPVRPGAEDHKRIASRGLRC